MRSQAARAALAAAAVLMPLASACSAPAPAASPPPQQAQSQQAQSQQARSQLTPPATPPPASPDRASHSEPVTTGIGHPGRFRTGRARLTVIEPAHTGPAGDQLGPRPLLIQLWYPRASGASGAGGVSRTSGASQVGRAAPGPLPLIAFGPGFMQCGGPYAVLLRSWASAGYVVAAVNFPRSDCMTGAAATESDLVNQPADMSFAITALMRRSAAETGLLAGRLDRGEIAIAGQSDGGDTVAAVAANSCCTDRRVRAVAVLSGAEWPAMPGTFFARPPVPMLFTQGDADTVNLPGCSVTMYRSDPEQSRFYLGLLGADHTGPYWGANRYERIVARVTLAFFDHYVLGQDVSALRLPVNARNVARLFSHGRGNLPDGPCVT
jgi:dienelactone hydrolase